MTKHESFGSALSMLSARLATFMAIQSSEGVTCELLNIPL